MGLEHSSLRIHGRMRNEMYLHCGALSIPSIASLTHQEFAWNATSFESAICSPCKAFYLACFAATQTHGL